MNAWGFVNHRATVDTVKWALLLLLVYDPQPWDINVLVKLLQNKMHTKPQNSMLHYWKILTHCHKLVPGLCNWGPTGNSHLPRWLFFCSWLGTSSPWEPALGLGNN